MSLVLIDSSAWVAFFRGDREAVRRIDPLLADGDAAIGGPIYCELLSGARNRPDFQRLRESLHGLEWLREPESAWERVGETRFLLARLGFQAATVDVLIALTAAEAAATLLTRDTDFQHIQAVVPIDSIVF